MKKKFVKGFFLIFLTTIFTAGGQIFFNYASEDFVLNFQGIIFNYFMWLGFITYGLGLLVLILGLRDGELSSLYPILSLSYIWVLIASALLFNEPVTSIKIVGTVIITLGVAIIGLQSNLFKVKQNG